MLPKFEDTLKSVYASYVSRGANAREKTTVPSIKYSEAVKEAFVRL